MRALYFLCGLLIIPTLTIRAQHDTTRQHNSKEHNHMSHEPGKTGDTPLTEPGNDIFGTIQEAIHKLEQNPNTDWSDVDIEALRQHLLDMKAMTENTEVVESRPIGEGLKVAVHPTTKRAQSALERVFEAHPAMLKKETGWAMTVDKQDDNYLIKITTDNPDEVSKIRGLGYIGVMAYGSHHQKHHWMMARDGDPHKKH